MDFKNQTKLLFAKQLEEMLKTIPMDKIRIVDLCKRCNTIPQTFYYHFHDKYELIAWIFLYDFSRTYINKELEYSINSIVDNLKQMNKRRIFYQKTYTQRSQNSIDQYIQKFNVQSATDAVEDYFKKPLSFEQLIEIKYHSYGMMGLFQEWITDDSSISIEQLASFQYEHTPDFLRKAYQNYSFKHVLKKNTSKANGL
ncbi:TetR/AcrR family transcriptional regulator C-terminal domain-containing protein [Companilactobacillus alimentarius]|uniref:TetR/AcrR family transcriptional regulator C-terminal domain-containing protein n=1 Tax=Companilactobacillus alimentarius TaxID=1602 RepID=UPI0028B6AF85|nr:TetR/AcrR family transcriptional regulator C-terminal domain-containing protein [Companilactobacillus alimentarius]MDT6951564.1 TetR/AcrR family transcriptional regulator C-terminal domain-containing protein [Companilactobacillus alimentarius]